MTKCVIISAPSGSGKSTIVQWLMKEHPELHLSFSVSATSRKPRGKEVDGIHYHFLSNEQFRSKLSAGEFLEYQEVYGGSLYGTLRAPVEELLREGRNVAFDIDVKGGINIKKHYGQRAISLFIQPPSIEELRRRLEGRGTDTQEQIETRLAKAEYEMSFAPQFDYIVVNDDLEKAKEETFNLLSHFLCK